MTSFFIAGAYLLGVLLSYGRNNASHQEHPHTDSVFLFTASIFSWLGFLIGVSIYFQYDQKQFLNFHN